MDVIEDATEDVREHVLIWMMCHVFLSHKLKIYRQYFEYQICSIFINLKNGINFYLSIKNFYKIIVAIVLLVLNLIGQLLIKDESPL